MHAVCSWALQKCAESVQTRRSVQNCRLCSKQGQGGTAALQISHSPDPSPSTTLQTSKKLNGFIANDLEAADIVQQTLQILDIYT